MRLAQQLLATDTTLYQVKLIDANGRGRLLVRATAPVPASSETDEGEYYAWRASSLGPRTHSVFPDRAAGFRR